MTVSPPAVERNDRCTKYQETVSRLRDVKIMVHFTIISGPKTRSIRFNYIDTPQPIRNIREA